MSHEHESERITCPQCAGDGAFLGTLGRLDWFRCIQCGWDFSRAHDTNDEGNNPIS